MCHLSFLRSKCLCTFYDFSRYKKRDSNKKLIQDSLATQVDNLENILELGAQNVDHEAIEPVAKVDVISDYVLFIKLCTNVLKNNNAF